MSILDEIHEKLQTLQPSGLAGWIAKTTTTREWLLEQTAQYDVPKLTQRLHIVIYGPPPYCECGNFRKFNTFVLGYRSGCDLGNKCLSVKNDRVNTQRERLLETYGVTNSFLIPESIEKRKNTMIERYGAEYSGQNPELMQKSLDTKAAKSNEERQATLDRTRQTNLERFGATHHMKVPEQQAKVRETHLQRHGTEFPAQHPETIEQIKAGLRQSSKESNAKRKETVLAKYGVEVASQIGLSEQTLKILDDANLFTEAITGNERQTVCQELGISLSKLYKTADRYGVNHLFKRPLISAFERELADWLTQHNIAFINGDRSIIAPQELDFFIPSHNLAIECDGLYWHSEAASSRDRNYHANKHKQCAQQNIQLITIFEDEWKFKQDRVLSRLSQLLNNRGVKIAARKCKLVQPSTADVRDFMNANHIQGHANHSVAYALEFDGAIVSIMTFGQSRYSKKTEWELVRYCSVSNVTGGAAKLFKHFLKTIQPVNVVSYSDNRWFTGSMYENLGFVQSTTTVGYFYTDYVNRFNRTRFQKHKLVEQGHDATLSEWQIMQDLGYDRIWDCGQVTWIFTESNDKD
jgi:hypothetical protein